MKTAEIIATGNELVQGDVVNTNAAHIAGELTRLGVTVPYHTTVGDEVAAIGSAVERALERADFIVVTGGLGPTHDDLTRDAVALAVGRRLVKDEAALAEIEEHFRCRDTKMSALNVRQAMIPEGSDIIPNKTGTAPGFCLAHKNTRIFCLPGVPGEMKRMLEDSVLPRLREAIDTGTIWLCRHVHVFGLSEALVSEKIADMMMPESNPCVGTMVHDGIITLRMTTESQEQGRAELMQEKGEAEIRTLLGKAVYGTDDDTLESVVAALFKKHNKTIATAESCTGGLVANYLTDVPGMSQLLLEGMVTYTLESKSVFLNIPRERIQESGTVNAEIAGMMAQAIREKTGADIGLSVTGVAGPTSQHPGEPVGLVYVAIATPDGVEHKEFHLKGTRKWIKLLAARHALNTLRLRLMSL